MSLSSESSPEAFDEVMAHVPALRSFFSRRSRRFDPDDLVQDLLLRVHQRGTAGDAASPVLNLKGYLYRVAANVLTDANRRSAVRHEHAACALSEHLPAEDIALDRVLEDRERLQLVLAALNQLPEKTRTMFVLARVEGLTYKAIAKRYGVSTSAVEKQMMRAIRHLTLRLQDADAEAADSLDP